MGATVIGSGGVCGMAARKREPGPFGHLVACDSTRYAYGCRTVSGQGVAERTCEACGWTSRRDVAPCVTRARFSAERWASWWETVEANEAAADARRYGTAVAS